MATDKLSRRVGANVDMPVRVPFKRVEKRLVGDVHLYTDAQTSSRMSRIGQQDTKPELAVRKACRALGVRYTTRNRDLPGSPDLANRSRGWAIFVHGCFWHHHVRCPHASLPRKNVAFWRAKFARNAERHQLAEVALNERGLRTLTLWQCEIESPETLARRLGEFLRHCGYRGGAKRG